MIKEMGCPNRLFGFAAALFYVDLDPNGDIRFFNEFFPDKVYGGVLFYTSNMLTLKV